MSVHTKQFEDGTVALVRAGANTPEDQEAVNLSVGGLPGTNRLASFFAPGGPARIFDAYEMLRREVNALNELVDSVFVGYRHEPYAGNLAVVSRVPSSNILAQHLVDPIADDSHGLDQALWVYQSIHAENVSVEGNRPAILFERWGRGDVSTDQYLVALRKRLADGATDDGPWIGDDIGQTWAVTSDGTYFTRGGLFAISGHATVHAGNYYVDNGGAYVALGPGTTSESATGTAIALARLAGSAAQIGDPYGNDVVLTLQGSLITASQVSADTEVRADGYTFRGHTVTGPEPRPTTVTAWGYGLWARSDGKLFLWNGSSDLEIPGAGGGASALDDLTDVDVSTTAPDKGDILAYDGDNNEWSNFPVGVSAGFLVLSASPSEPHGLEWAPIYMGYITDFVYSNLPIDDGEVMTWSSALSKWTNLPASGGSHALLSATHSDTVASTVSRGSIIRGNATPAWEEYPIGANNRYFFSDGTDAAWDFLKAAGFDTQGANAVLAGPTSGGAATPTFRALDPLDMPGGTAGTTWQIDTGATGPKLKRDAADILAVRNAADNAYAIARGADPVGAQDLVTLGVLDARELTLAIGHSRLYNFVDGSAITAGTYTLPVNYLNAAGSGLKIRAHGTAPSAVTMNLTFDDGTTAHELLKDTRDATTGIAVSGQDWVLDLELVKIGASGGDAHVSWRLSQVDGTGAPAIFVGEHKFTFTAANAHDIDLTLTGGGAGDDIDSFTIDFIGVLPADAVTENGDTAGTPTPAVASMPKVMTVRHRTGTEPNIFPLTAGTTLEASEGAITGEANESTTLTLATVRANDWVRYKGKEYVLNSTAGTNHRVFERDIASAINTTAVLNKSGLTSSAIRRTGLHVTNTGSGPILWFVYFTSTASHLVTFDGSTWTTSASMVVVPSACTIVAAGVAQQNGTAFVPIAGDTGVCGIVVVIAGATGTLISTATATANAGCFCPFYDRMFYMSGSTSSSVQRQVYEVVGGALVSRLSLALTGTDIDTATANKPAVLFPISNTELVAIFAGNVSGGTAANARYRASKVTFASASDITPTETILSSYLPAPLNTTAGIAYGIYIFHDTQSDPANPATYIFTAATITSAFSVAQHVATDTALSFAASGADATNYALPFGNDTVGGARFTLTTNDVIEDDVSITTSGSAGRMTISSEIQVESGTYTFKLWEKLVGRWAWTQATLAGSATGSGCLRVGNTVTGMTDNVPMTVDVDFTAMSIADAALVELMPAYYRQ